MGVYDDHRYSWFSDEKCLFFDAIREDKKIHMSACIQLCACVSGEQPFTQEQRNWLVS